MSASRRTGRFNKLGYACSLSPPSHFLAVASAVLFIPLSFSCEQQVYIGNMTEVEATLRVCVAAVEGLHVESLHTHAANASIKQRLTKTGMLWASAPGTTTMESKRCVHASSLPTCVSAAEYALAHTDNAEIIALSSHHRCRKRAATPQASPSLTPTFKQHEHDTRSPLDEIERDKHWVGYCVRKRRTSGSLGSSTSPKRSKCV